MASQVPLKFTIVGKWGQARAAKLELPHHVCETPMFMPVGTQGLYFCLSPSPSHNIILLLV